MLACKNCNTDFKPRSTGNVYCSVECRVEATAWKAEQKFCANPDCLAQFMTTRTHRDKKYCSRSCSATVSNRRSPRKISRFNYVTCQECANHFKQAIGKTTFCSLNCHVTHRRARATEKWLNTGIANISSDPKHYIRVYIAKEQKNCCSICKLSAIWQEKELRFILDHIDGNSENNYRDNLRLVCPNCDSQLDTYKSKNKGNGRHARRLRYANGQSY
jgi:hypothetical protein